MFIPPDTVSVGEYNTHTSLIQYYMVLIANHLQNALQQARTTGSCRSALGAALASGLPLTLFVGPAAAQTEVGNTLCGTPIAEFINGVVPLVVSLAMIVGAVFAAFMHARAGVARDAEQARFYLDWRNRAGYTAVTAPLLAFLIQMLIGLTGTGIASCVNLVPFF